MESLPLLSLPPMRLGAVRLATKRAVDSVVAGTMLIVLAPLVIAVVQVDSCAGRSTGARAPKRSSQGLLAADPTLRAESS